MLGLVERVLRTLPVGSSRLVIIIDAQFAQLPPYSMGELQRKFSGWILRPLFVWVNPKYSAEAEEIIREAYGGDPIPQGFGISLLRAFISWRDAELEGEAIKYVGDIKAAGSDVERTIGELTKMGARLGSALELSAGRLSRMLLRLRIGKICRGCSNCVTADVGSKLYAVLDHGCTLRLPLILRTTL